MRVALVHEYFNQWGGAERVLCTLAEMFPDAPIYTLFHDEKILPLLPESVRSRLIPSILQKFSPWLLKKRVLFPLYPTIIEQFDFSDCDLVISSSSAYAKNIITRPQTMHICYCHSPMRYAWDWYHNYLREQKLGWFSRKILPFIFTRLRIWDHVGAKRVEYFIANSAHVQQRIQKYYQRDSTIIYPSVKVKKTDLNFLKEKRGDYYLLVSRLSPYKKIELAIQACNELKLPLKIVGQGNARADLEKFAGPTIEFLGRVDEDTLQNLYRNAKALLFPGEEDFGMVMVEALGSGIPVIAYKAGGAEEIIEDGRHGILFTEPTTESLVDGIQRFEGLSFDREQLYEWALTFDEQIFKDKLLDFIEEVFK